MIGNDRKCSLVDIVLLCSGLGVEGRELVAIDTVEAHASEGVAVLRGELVGACAGTREMRVVKGLVDVAAKERVTVRGRDVDVVLQPDGLVVGLVLCVA